MIVGGALVLPMGLLNKLQNKVPSLFARQTKAVEDAAMRAVMVHESQSGFIPKDVSGAKLGWDIESQAGEGKLRFLEVKGRVEGATTVTVTKKEILAALNKPDVFFLAIVEVIFDGEQARGNEPRYIKRPFQREPDFAAVSVNYEMKELFKEISN